MVYVGYMIFLQGRYFVFSLFCTMYSPIWTHS